MRTIQYTPPNYQPASGLRGPFPIREFRGVNTLDPFSILDSQAMSSKNLTASRFPALTTRPGFSILGTFGSRVLGIGAFKDREIHAVFNDGTWRRMESNGTWTQLASGLDTEAEWTFCNYLGSFSDINLIAANGVDPVKRYDGTTVQNLNGAPAGANYIAVYQYRLWALVGNELHATAVDNAEDWATFDGGDDDSYVKTLESPMGQTSNAIVTGLSRMVVGFPSAVVDWFGGVPSDFRDKPATEDVGFVNNKSGIIHEGMLYFYDSKGFYQYGGGVRPSRQYSRVVQTFADTANAASRGESCSGTDGERIFFSFPSSGAADPDTVLEYDPRGERQTWYPWEGLRVVCFARMGDSTYVGDSLGRVLRLGGANDAGTPIAWEWVTKPFTGALLAQIIRWIRIWVTALVPPGSTFSVSISKSVDGDDWTLLKTLTPSDEVQSDTIYVHPSSAANARQLRLKFHGTGPMTLYEWAPEIDNLPPR